MRSATFYVVAMNKKTATTGRLASHVLLNGSVQCSLFLNSPLCFISHLAFPLCAALVIVFLWSALAFDMQTPKTLAALQIHRLSHNYLLCLTVSVVFTTLSLTDPKQVMDQGDQAGCHLLKLRFDWNQITVCLRRELCVLVWGFGDGSLEACVQLVKG